MKTKLKFAAAVAAGLLISFAAPAATSERDAYKAARVVIPQDEQTHVLSIYGKGTPKAIETWYVKFRDPAAKTNARIVVVEKKKVVRSNAADDRDENDEPWSFDPAKSKVGIDAALKTAGKYAKENVITYNQVKAYLKRPSLGKAPMWTIEILNDGVSQGYIYASNKDGSFAGYRPPTRDDEVESGGTTAKSFGEEVEETFLGIGADLEEFFTGERTVDK